MIDFACVGNLHSIVSSRSSSHSAHNPVFFFPMPTQSKILVCCRHHHRHHHHQNSIKLMQNYQRPCPPRHLCQLQLQKMCHQNENQVIIINVHGRQWHYHWLGHRTVILIDPWSLRCHLGSTDVPQSFVYAADLQQIYPFHPILPFVSPMKSIVQTSNLVCGVLVGSIVGGPTPMDAHTRQV